MYLSSDWTILTKTRGRPPPPTNRALILYSLHSLYSLLFSNILDSQPALLRSRNHISRHFEHICGSVTLKDIIITVDLNTEKDRKGPKRIRPIQLTCYLSVVHLVNRNCYTLSPFYLFIYPSTKLPKYLPVYIERFRPICLSAAGPIPTY